MRQKNSELKYTKVYKQMLKMKKTLPDCCYVGYYQILGIDRK